jgi:flagellar protein FliJ
MAQFIYRLQLLLEQKEETRKAAEREVARREQELQAEQEKLRTLQQREQELVERKRQLRRELLSQPGQGGALTAGEVIKRSEDVKVVELQIEDAQQDICAQRAVIEQCEAKLEDARKRVEEARREVEVLTKHRAKQEERFHRAEQAQEELALDEIGNVLHTVRRREL